MTPKKDPVEVQDEGRTDGKEGKEKEEEMKRGNNSNGQEVNNENEEKNGEGGEGSNMKLQPTEDDENADKLIEEEEEEQELSGDEDDLESTGGIPYELNKRAVITLERLPKTNEDDLEMVDEELVSRFHKLEEQRVEALGKGYPCCYTHWVEGKYEVVLEAKERRREDPTEQSLEEAEILRKTARKRVTGEEGLTQRGAIEGNRDATREESKKVMTQREEHISIGKRKRTDETEKEKKKTKTESLPRQVDEGTPLKEKEREAVTRGKNQERKIKKLKKDDLEGKSLQRGVEENETKLQGKKANLPQLRIRKGDERMTTQYLQEVMEPLAMEEEEEEEEEEEDCEQELERRTVQQEEREAPPEAASRPQQAAVCDGGQVNAVRRRRKGKKRQQVPRSVIQPAPKGRTTPMAAAAEARRTRGGVGVPRAVGRAGRRSPPPPSPTSVTRQVFVKGLPPGTTPQEILAAMESFGAVSGVSQPRRASFGFVSFKEKGGKQAALQARTVRLPRGAASIRTYLCQQCRRPRWTPRGRAGRVVRW